MKRLRKLVQYIFLSTLINYFSSVYANSKEIISAIIKHNQQYLDLIDEHYFTNKNKPRVTILTCSDSRIDMEFLNSGVIHDFFIIRNLGNQLDVNQHSVEYGVRKMQTPILIILGHSDCEGATFLSQDKIKDALENTKIEKSKLDVVQNLNKQVSLAVEIFNDLINTKKLLIIGALYDFNNQFQHGNGKLLIINVNGESDVKLLKNNPFLKNVKDIAFNEK